MVMKVNMYESLVSSTLTAIAAGKGTKGLSLRAIARDAGCSHANVYHYSKGLDGLVWEAYSRALADFSRRCEERMAKPALSENIGSAFARAACDYALRNEGLYRLLWLDSLPKPVPITAIQTVATYSGAYVDKIKAVLGSADAERSACFLMAFVMGEIAMILAGRIMEGPEAAAARAVEGAGALWEMILRRK